MSIDEGQVTTETKFTPMQKIGRLSRNCTITEKIDGTNASIFISEDLSEFLVGSRTKWITPGKQTDNYGFAKWAYDHKEELMQLGPGQHFGEWWGLGIQRRYDLSEKRFSLFNTNRWADGRQTRPACCYVVPVLYEGIFTTEAVNEVIANLRIFGSKAAPGFQNPEGIVIYHHATKQLFKKTLDKDDQPKGQKEE
jgi:hypothetical protein